MKEELDKKLCASHPEIFKDRHGNQMVTAMCWGFECGDGWFNLIDIACNCIDTEVKNNKSRIEWYKSRDEEPPEEIFHPIASQVKEKFGGLRFYTDGADSICQAYITMAEAMSYRTCEQCGKPGKASGNGWVRTLCEECRDK